ncbi:carbon-nitrogen hydrolase family protein [Rhodohalobacter mucosus]|uniref:Carbon-nitrogen hydrolase n=1 Tax=Rhodohalobacter mucosus TaxID=2079485 RepID=A0A316U278_9BACT|nr:carbon-nitrogen hydrolase family protein [Rhodohalobacter mucosus]PWN07246.1 carbon-nitrogen hydrolase [Rhodohalobacter mucosus]
MSSENQLTVALAQISPVWLKKSETLKKIELNIREAANNGAELVAFGEGLLPGYPHWLANTMASEWNSAVQKELFAHYVNQAVRIEKGDLSEICKLAGKNKIAVYLGLIERAADRGGHSVYCSLVYIDPKGEIQSVHRKLQPTYDERLAWAQGDGNGLQVHPLKAFSVGGLNCWENWMPLPRAALYGMGEDLHVAVWPGSIRNTKDITRFMALEGRSFVLSVSSLMRTKDFPPDTPHLDLILEQAPEVLTDGGSCIAAPDGSWVAEPCTNEEKLIIRTLDYERVLEERQNFDPAGHYSRPDVTRLVLNRERQSTIEFK